MIRYRPFRNSDPPVICDVWRRQPPMRGLAHPMTPTLLERLVLSKLYFDPQGLILAWEDDRAIGFVHAGFGPNEELTDISTELGVTCLLLVAPHPRQAEVATELVAQSEEYLRRRGAKVLYAGGIRPLSPFYLGLYGGSELPGVLLSDPVAQAAYRSSGYREIDRCLIYQRELSGFRPPVDRFQLQIRRSYALDALFDPEPADWWEACTEGLTHRTRFLLRPQGGAAACGSATFWDMDPLASSWGVRAAGLSQLEVAADFRRKGLATFLVAESLKQLQQLGVTLCEVQTMQANTAAQGLYGKLGFKEVDQGVVFRKEN